MSCFLKLYYVRTLQGFVAIVVLRLPSASRIDYANIHLYAVMIGAVPVRLLETYIFFFFLQCHYTQSLCSTGIFFVDCKSVLNMVGLKVIMVL